MKQLQKKAALEAMIDWLSHPSELGRAPSRIVCAGEFDLYDMHYYIFKFKKTFFGKWMVGVCGGFEEDSIEPSGHVFSDMKEYHKETAKDECITMVEMIRAIWIRQLEIYSDQMNK